MMAVSADADDDTGGAASRTAAGPQLPLLRPGEPHTPAADLSMSVFESLSTPVVARSLPASPSLGLLPGPSPGSLLPPTANQSPLAASIHAWHARLCQVHAVFCDHSCPPACLGGVRSLAVLLRGFRRLLAFLPPAVRPWKRSCSFVNCIGVSRSSRRASLPRMFHPSGCITTRSLRA